MTAGTWWAIAIVALGVGVYAAHRAGAVQGGLSEGMHPRDFDARVLREGTDVELEHTSNRRVAQKIAMDHLVEDPEYYRKLVRAGL